jgi:hypothetical protein
MPSDAATLTHQPAARYVGRRYADDDGSVAIVMREDEAGIGRPLPLRLDLANKSPTGPEWGYGGSGPAQLALAILADALGDHQAQRHYQQFKWAMIATLPGDAWELTREQIQDWIAQQPAQES